MGSHDLIYLTEAAALGDFSFLIVYKFSFYLLISAYMFVMLCFL